MFLKFSLVFPQFFSSFPLAFFLFPCPSDFPCLVKIRFKFQLLVVDSFIKVYIGNFPHEKKYPRLDGTVTRRCSFYSYRSSCLRNPWRIDCFENWALLSDSILSDRSKLGLIFRIEASTNENVFKHMVLFAEYSCICICD